MLCIIKEFTYETLAIRVKRRLNSTDVLERLADLMILRCAGLCSVRQWAGRPDSGRPVAAVGVQTVYIEPGSPWEKSYCESFNSKLRDELLLDGEIFYNLAEADRGLETPSGRTARSLNGRQRPTSSVPEAARRQHHPNYRATCRL
jgi:hypothetical protein